MPRRPSLSSQDVRAGLSWFRSLSQSNQRLLLGLAAIGLLAAILFLLLSRPTGNSERATTAGTNADGPSEYLFCFWNVENLFDDIDDKRRDVDEEFDNPFATDAALRREKYDHVAKALLGMNGGKGPDVIACVEVESVRAAELLRGTLNRMIDEAKLDPKWKYTQVAMKNLDAGRHIAPCLITRLDVSHALTRLHGRQLRILEAHVQVNGHDLCVLATHWTSQLKQRDGSGGAAGREKYADLIFDIFAQKAARNPNTDLLLCGDFNDSPDSRTITDHLGGTGDRTRVVPRMEKPQLLDLMIGKDPRQFGTHWYNGRPLIYDHICLSPGMLDREGWSCDPDSVRTVHEGLIRPGSTRPEPWRFGGPKTPPFGGRGYSDHFPVTVKLVVRPPSNGSNSE